MQALKKCHFVHYFFVARIVIIIGVALLCFSSRYVSARQGQWVWQKRKSEQFDNQVEPAVRKKTHIKRKKKVVLHTAPVMEREVTQETVVTQKTETEPYRAPQSSIISPELASSGRPARIVQEQKPIAPRVKTRRIQRRVPASKVVETSEVSSVEQQESPSPAPMNDTLESESVMPAAGFNEVDSYWNWLLNPRPWWELAGQRSVFRP